MRELRHPTRIIVHCAATENGKDVPASEIRRWHVDERGFDDIGYHAVIRPSGAIEYGRPYDKQGAHVKGQNHDTLGFCLVGTDAFTRAQMRSLRHVVISACAEFNIQLYDIFGHYEFDEKKTCPGIPMADLLRFIQSNNLHYVRDNLLD